MRHSKAELEDIRRQLGRRVAELRKMRNPPWTQFDLAAASGCRPEAISRIERGTVDFAISNIYKIAAALAVPPENLVALKTDGGGRGQYPNHASTVMTAHETNQVARNKKKN